jgi:DNA helicase-2/ATP-dependent DNA helicase PcrA
MRFLAVLYFPMASNSTFTFSTEQRDAIEHDGPLLIMAGAGSGKTTVLAERIAQRIRSGRCDPYRMLAVTFSVKAAHELRQRLSDTLSPDLVGMMTVMTLHALGLRLLREHGDVLGYKLDESRRKPSVRNTHECQAALTHIAKNEAAAMAERGSTTAARLLSRMDASDLAQRISLAKTSGIAPETFAHQPAVDPTLCAVAACYSAYQAILKHDNAVDFDDLILQPLQLLDPVQFPDAYAYLTDRFGDIACDEFQDTSPAQYELMKRLASKGATLTMIGDAHQTVFGFRGAMGGEGFKRFRTDFPAAKPVTLQHNFRSAGHIVRVGDAVLGDLKPPQIPTQADGATVSLVRVGSEFEEADVVANEIVSAVSMGAARYDQCAVICRTNAQIAPIERALLNRHLPYTVLKRGGFFEQSEIRHLLAYISLAIDTNDHYAFRQIINAPARGIGKTEFEILKGADLELTVDSVLYPERIEQLKEVAQGGIKRLVEHDLSGLIRLKDQPPIVVIAFILSDEGIAYQRYLKTKSDPAARTERIEVLQRMAREHTTLKDFLDEMDVMSGQDPIAAHGHERVQLMTVHDSKGLEFELVFFVGVEEGLLPHYNAADSQRGLLDERRLCYVGLTRARKALVLTYARTRNGRPALPSRFLRGLPVDCISRAAPSWG